MLLCGGIYRTFKTHCRFVWTKNLDVFKMQSGETLDSDEPTPTPPPPYYGSSEENDSPPRYFQGEPPSYDSIFVRVRTARDESHGVLDFFKRCASLVAGTVGCGIAIALCFGVPVASIVIGSLYMFDCPVERFIPIYLVVGGCVSLITTFISLIDRQRRRIEEFDHQHDRRNNVSPLNALFSCFLFAWFIAGNVWVFRTYGRFTSEPTQTDYCHPVLYSFAFWLTTVTYLVFVVFCGCFCVSSCIFGCLSTSRPFEQS